MSTEYKYGELTSEIISAAMEVHRTLGNGFQEVIYQRALEIEFTNRQLQFGREVEMPLYYKGHDIGLRRVDFIFNNTISIELKPVTKLEDVHLAPGIELLGSLQPGNRFTAQFWQQQP